MIPWAYPSPRPKQHLHRFCRFCTDNRRMSLYFTMGRPSHLKIANPQPTRVVLWHSWRCYVTYFMLEVPLNLNQHHGILHSKQHIPAM